MKGLLQLGLAFVLGAATVSGADTAVNLAIEKVTGAKTDTVTVGVSVESPEFAKGDSIVSYQFDFHYDPSVLQLDSVKTRSLTAETVPSGMSFSMGVHEGEGDEYVSFAMATTTPLIGTFGLARLAFVVVGDRGDEAELWLDKDKEPTVYAVHTSPARKTVIEFPPRTRIKNLRIRITDVEGGVLGAASVGFTEIELH